MDDSQPAGDKRHSPTLKPRTNLAMLAHAIMTEVDSIEQCLGRPQSEIDPIVSGGVSRIEALINDLLSFSRDSGTLANDFQVSAASCAEVAMGLTGLLASGSFPEA
jgi:hypothetical protein